MKRNVKKKSFKKKLKKTSATGSASLSNKENKNDIATSTGMVVVDRKPGTIVRVIAGTIGRIVLGAIVIVSIVETQRAIIGAIVGAIGGAIIGAIGGAIVGAIGGAIVGAIGGAIVGAIIGAIRGIFPKRRERGGVLHCRKMESPISQCEPSDLKRPPKK